MFGLTWVCRTPRDTPHGVVQGCGAGASGLMDEPPPTCPVCHQRMRNLAREVAARLAEANLR